VATLIYSAVPVLCVADVGAIENREYGCRELAILDPDGHVVVLGKCG
jgi:hypothetical protein